MRVHLDDVGQIGAIIGVANVKFGVRIIKRNRCTEQIVVNEPAESSIEQAGENDKRVVGFNLAKVPGERNVLTLAWTQQWFEVGEHFKVHEPSLQIWRRGGVCFNGKGEFVP